MAIGFLSKWFGGSKRDGAATLSSSNERRLLHRCRGDRELAERLIASELARKPNLSRAAAADRAADRWENER